jgi:hypothetical protein
MIERRIDTGERKQFLSRFSRLHRGALVSLSVDGREQVLDQPFRGVSCDDGDLIVHLGDGAHAAHLGRRVTRVSSVSLEQTDEGADLGLAIRTKSGQRTEVRFRSPMRADLLDPAVE